MGLVVYGTRDQASPVIISARRQKKFEPVCVDLVGIELQPDASHLPVRRQKPLPQGETLDGVGSARAHVRGRNVGLRGQPGPAPPIVVFAIQRVGALEGVPTVRADNGHAFALVGQRIETSGPRQRPLLGLGAGINALGDTTILVRLQDVVGIVLLTQDEAIVGDAAQAFPGQNLLRVGMGDSCTQATALDAEHVDAAADEFVGDFREMRKRVVKGPDIGQQFEGSTTARAVVKAECLSTGLP